MQAPTFAAHVVPVSHFDMNLPNCISTYCFVIAGELDATKMQQSFDKLVMEHWPIIGARLRRKSLERGVRGDYFVPESFSDEIPTCIFQHEHIEGPDTWTERRKTDTPSIQATYSKEVPLYLPHDRPATMDAYYNSNRPLFHIKMTTASKANVTYLSITVPHLFTDAGGITLLLEGWSSVLKDQANLVPPLFSTAPMESWKLSKPVDEGAPGLWLVEDAEAARILGESLEGVEVRDIFMPRSFLSALRADAMEALEARGAEESFLSEGDCLWAWWTKLSFPARTDKNAKLNLGQAINFRNNFPGFNDGPHKQIRNAFGGMFLLPSLSPDEVDAMPLHELAYIIRRSVLNLREHPEDVQDQAIVMAQIYLGGKPLINFDPKLDINIFSNWLSMSFNSAAVDFSPALEGSTVSRDAGRIINARYYRTDSTDHSSRTFALCKDSDGDIWMNSQMHKDLWEHPRLKALMTHERQME